MMIAARYFRTGGLRQITRQDRIKSCSLWADPRSANLHELHYADINRVGKMAELVAGNQRGYVDVVFLEANIHT